MNVYLVVGPNGKNKSYCFGAWMDESLAGVVSRQNNPSKVVPIELMDGLEPVNAFRDWWSDNEEQFRQKAMIVGLICLRDIAEKAFNAGTRMT